MRGFGWAVVAIALACGGCAQASDAAPRGQAASSAPFAASETPSPQQPAEAGSVYGPHELDTRDALAPFDTIELVSAEGVPISVDVPAESVCPEAQCAILAAINFMAMQDDVIAGRAVDAWLAMSSPDCYFCMDTVAVRDELVAAGITVEGGYVTLNDTPVVYTEDYLLEMPPYDGFDFSDASLVPLSLSTDQAEIVYNDHGTISRRETVWVTFLMVLRWDGTYWTVDAVMLT